MFENSLTIISEIGIPWLHVFPFSPRQGTPAAKIPAIDGNTVKARAKALREAGIAEKTRHIAKRDGETDIALFEDTGLGRLPDFTLIDISNPPVGGTLAKIRITGQSAGHATGELI